MSSTAWKKTKLENPTFVCRECKSNDVRYRLVTSSDEAHEDYNYHCDNCSRDWWIDGADY